MTALNYLHEVQPNTDWTVRFFDHYWEVFTFDVYSDPEGKYAGYRYNKMYPIGRPSDGIHGWAYDIDIDGVMVYDNRREAELAAKILRVKIDDWHNEHSDDENPGVHVINMGDANRYEATLIGRDSRRICRPTPKFKGSEAAWAAMTEMHERWLNADRARAERESDE